MRITHTVAATVAAHLGALTNERVSVRVGTGRDGYGYRVTLAASPTARQLTWDSARNEGRKAVAYMLGAVDAYTDGEAFDRTPFLADLLRVLAYRPELSDALRWGREDGTAARPTAPAPLVVGDEYTGIATNGHRMVYTVAGFYEDGTPRAANGSAYHADTCPCVAQAEEEADL
ncbi:hypothetical protein [Streptomyces sp. NPDC091879]|uniref:hypothetical protein n=1 Tax=Streptomyces sp. NPDC091879 TaxID=3366006 RepID=UPI00381A7144